jgi:hypothetical protein
MNALDVAYIGLALVFFGLSARLVRFTDVLMKRGDR